MAEDLEGYFSLTELIKTALSDPGLLGYGKDELDAVIALLSPRAKEYEESRPLSEHGPCLFCWEDTEYWPLSKLHTRHGERWYDRLISVGKASPYIFPVNPGSEDMDAGKMCGFPFGTVRGYVCDLCRASIGGRVSARAGKHEEEKRLALIEANAERAAKQADFLSLEFIPDNYLAAFKEMRWTCDASTRLALRQMPYGDFLKSAFWRIVRAGARKEARNQCKLCGRAIGLQVHHRSYEHRGSEDLYMDDLIVLCISCHRGTHTEDATSC